MAEIEQAEGSRKRGEKEKGNGAMLAHSPLGDSYPQLSTVDMALETHPDSPFLEVISLFVNTCHMLCHSCPPGTSFLVTCFLFQEHCLIAPFGHGLWWHAGHTGSPWCLPSICCPCGFSSLDCGLAPMPCCSTLAETPSLPCLLRGRS